MASLINKEHLQILTQRISGISGILGVLILILIVRLFVLQIVHEERYRLLSDKNRIDTIFLGARRGRILDRKGRVLAFSQFQYEALVDPHRDMRAHWEKITEYFGIPETSFAAWVKQKRHNALPNGALVLKDQLSWKDIVFIEKTAANLPGIYTAKKALRQYAYGASFAHLVGYVTQPTGKDIERDANLKVLGSVVGRSGVERTYDLLLRGELGMIQTEVNATHRVVRVLEEKRPAPGEDCYLTLDAELQNEVEQLMRSVRRGAAVVLDITSGAVLAMVSCPSFDPSIFANPVSAQEWNALMKNPDHPFLNRAISGQYSPGSTFKPLVALTALQEGVISPTTTFFCPGYYEVNGHRFHCWKWRYGGHGFMNVKQALEQSCDVFFYHIATQIKPNTLIETARNFGLGEKTGVHLPHEKAGVLPSLFDGWKSITPGFSINLSIGQGKILATPLQLAALMASLVSHKKIIPYIIRNHACAQLPLPYKPTFLKIVQKGMEAVVDQAMGTAHHIQNDLLSIGGKTGSTQVYRITQAERLKGKLEERPYHLKDHALFIGFAPVDNPRFAVAIIIEHGESGGRVAAPMARDILLAAQKHIA